MSDVIKCDRCGAIYERDKSEAIREFYVVKHYEQKPVNESNRCMDLCLLCNEMLKYFMNEGKQDGKKMKPWACEDCGMIFYRTTGKQQYCEFCSAPARRQARYRRKKNERLGL